MPIQTALWYLALLQYLFPDNLERLKRFILFEYPLFVKCNIIASME